MYHDSFITNRNSSLGCMELPENIKKIMDSFDKHIEPIHNSQNNLHSLIALIGDLIEENMDLTNQIKKYEENMIQEKAYKILEARLKRQEATIELLRSQIEELKVWNNKKRAGLGVESYEGEGLQ